MNNKDLFKQAIAEAKTIREAAITNAKEALEESLTPHLKEMLAQKLQEMEKSEEDETKVMDENIYEAEEEEVETPEEDEATEEEGEEEPTEEDEELDLENMTKEEFTDLVLSIVAQEKGDEEAPEGEEDMPVDDMTSMDDSEEININELLAELEGMNNNQINEGFDEWLDRVSAQMKQFGENNPAIRALDKAIKAAQTATVEKGYSSGAKYESAGTEYEMEEGLGDTIKGAVSKVGDAIQGAVGTGGKFDQWIDRSKSKIDKVVPPHPYVKQQAMNKESVELREALQAVKVLRNQLQEVNLLNAKLLYVNKLFKSNNLSEGQKVNVIAAFDKAETVREVKLVFETVSKNVVAKKVTSIKEHTFASKPTGTTKAPQREVINEVSEQVLRMQKLAGIIK